MIPAPRTEAVLSEDGKRLLDQLPFRTGQTVKVILLTVAREAPPGQALRGPVLLYDQPPAPVAEADCRSWQP